MRAKLSCRSGPFRGLELAVGEEAVIGSAEGSTVRLASPAVAASHARIRFDPERQGFFLEDLGSRAGTVLDGVPVTHEERLDRLHVITVGGEIDLVFQRLAGEPAAVPAAEPGAAVEGEGTRVDREMPTLPLALREGEQPAPVEAAEAGEGTRIEKQPVGLPGSLARMTAPAGGEAARTSAFVLEVEVEGGETRRIALRPGENVVGRAREARARIDSPGISRRHAVLVVTEAGGASVRDLKSRNHTWVGERRLEGDDEVELAAGARLRFGAVEARLVEE